MIAATDKSRQIRESRAPERAYVQDGFMGASGGLVANDRVEFAMKRLILALALALTLDCRVAIAQVGGMAGGAEGATPFGLGATGPLGNTAGTPVAPPGIPMGAIGLANPGVSPGPSGMACGTTVGAAAGVSSTMSGSTGGSSSGGMSGLSGLSTYDGGGFGACANGQPGAGASGGSTTVGGGVTAPSSPGEPVAKPGIPLGSTELAGGGISPAPVINNFNVTPILPPTAPPSSPCVTIDTSNTSSSGGGSMSTSSSSVSTSNTAGGC